MRVAIIGSGYVGLISGVCLASKGHKVICVDTQLEIVEALNSARPHIYEKGLQPLLESVLKSGFFHATADMDFALSESEVVIVAVGTPSHNGIINLDYIQDVSNQIGSFLKRTRKFLSVVIKSTVVPGTTDTIVRKEIEKASGKTFPDFGLGMNPEFLREGEAIADFMDPDRIVIGYEDQRTLTLLEELYAPWKCNKIRVNTRTAELIKYANNTLLATQISAINEIANLAAKIGGIDIMDVVEGIHLDKRWNPIFENKRLSPLILSYLIPGCGFGGSCFPKDVQALRAHGIQHGITMKLLDAVLDINEEQPHQVLKILLQELGTIYGQKILVLGLAFKPETDDVRESSSIKIVRDMLDNGAELFLHDPIAVDNFKKLITFSSDNLIFVKDWKNYLSMANIIIIATKWSEYYDLVSYDLRNKVIFDARRMFSPEKCNGAKYLAIGLRSHSDDGISIDPGMIKSV